MFSYFLKIGVISSIQKIGKDPRDPLSVPTPPPKLQPAPTSSNQTLESWMNGNLGFQEWSKRMNQTEP